MTKVHQEIAGRHIEWDEEHDDDHLLKLSCGCMTFEIDLDGGTLTLETDVDTQDQDKLNDFCEDVVRLFNKHKML